MIAWLTGTLVIMLFLQLRYNLFAPASKGIPILVYHKVSEDIATRESVTTFQLEQQFQHINEKQYHCIKLADLLNPDFVYPPKPLILTFDDGYLNNLEYLYPLLVKYDLKATIMLPVSYIGTTSEWDENAIPLLSYEQLLQMDPRHIEFGLHSYSHKDLRYLSLEELAEDIHNCFTTLSEHHLPFVPVLAYPYGKFPRKNPQKARFFHTLKENGIPMAMRIGNKYNGFKLKNPFEIKRISIKGNEAFWIFKTKLKKGRVKTF